MTTFDVYPLTELEENYYQFFSEGGSQYHVYFRLNYQNDVVQLYTDNKQVEVYEFFFEVVNVRSLQAFDKKLTNTVMQLLEQFLIDNRHRVLFYITNRDDERNHALFRIYEVWYRNYIRERDSSLGKIDRVISQGSFVEAYMSCIYLNMYLDKQYVNECLDRVLEEIYPNYTISASR